MDNFFEVNAVDELFKELRSLLDSKHYLGALCIALTLPDSLGKVAYPSVSSSKERYIRWFDDHVYNFFGLLYSDKFYEDRIHFTGTTCYQLRCKLFHENTNDIGKTTGIDEFVLGFNDERVFTGQTAGSEPHFDEWNPETGYLPVTRYLYIGVNEICTDILEAAESFLAINPDLDYPKLKMNNGDGKIPRFLFSKKIKKNQSDE